MDHSDLGDLTRHNRTCGWWYGAAGTEGAAYERDMTNRALDYKCTCSLRHRMMIATEREMHAAWRKRGEEAEADASNLRTAARAVREVAQLSGDHLIINNLHTWNVFCAAIGDRA